MAESIQQPGLLRELLDFAFPPLCSGCGAYVEDTTEVCCACCGRIDWFDSPFFINFDSPEEKGKELKLLAGAEYTDPMKSIIVSFKFHGVTGLAGFLVDGLIAHHEKELKKLTDAVLVPIPLHPSREYHRGYNQAEILAEHLGQRLERPVNEYLLERTRLRKPQARLRRRRRTDNIRGVFEIDPDEIPNLHGKRVVLVDDVVTSGATIGEAASVLEQHGIEVAAAIAMAHGL